MEKAILVGVDGLKGGKGTTPSTIEELRRLLETAGGVAVDAVVQTREKPDPATFIGSGKVDELAQRARDEKLSIIVFDEDLSPTQQKNLQEKIPAKIVDRTRLILDIFAQRARTREGKLQVELAQLSYTLPRMTERYGRFEQQTGGIGTRGPGERKLEVEQRHARRRIQHIKGDIEKLKQQRSLQRADRKRVPLPIAALVGYTNVGKSTLLNALSGGDKVYADDKLFATLDPTTRRVTLPDGQPVLLVDTVGFIQKLPHALVAAFRATLEEVAEAALVLHVVDASHPEWTKQARVVDDVLADLGAEDIPRRVVFNKADRLGALERKAFERDQSLLVSAATGEGLDRLRAELQTFLSRRHEEHVLVLPHDRGDVIPYLYKTGAVLEDQHDSDGRRLRVRLDRAGWHRVQRALKRKKPAVSS